MQKQRIATASARDPSRSDLSAAWIAIDAIARTAILAIARRVAVGKTGGSEGTRERERDDDGDDNKRSRIVGPPPVDDRSSAMHPGVDRRADDPRRDRGRDAAAGRGLPHKSKPAVSAEYKR